MTMRKLGIKVKVLCHYILSMLVVIVNVLSSMIYVITKGSTPFFKTLFSTIWEELSAKIFYWHLWGLVDPWSPKSFSFLYMFGSEWAQVSSSPKPSPFCLKPNNDLSIRCFLLSSCPQVSYLFIKWVDHFLLSHSNLSLTQLTLIKSINVHQPRQSVSVTIAVSPGQSCLLGGHCYHHHKVRDKSQWQQVLILCVNKETKDSQSDKFNNYLNFKWYKENHLW